MRKCYDALTLLIRFSVASERTALGCHPIRKYARAAASVRVPRLVSCVHRTNRSVVAMVMLPFINK